MSYTKAEVTITVGGYGEIDCLVRCRVDVEPGLGMGGSTGAALDGTPDARIEGEWLSVDGLDLDEGDDATIEEALCNAAIEDDSDSEEWDDRAFDDHEAAE